ncbi:MAG TPA: hypothetical protein VLH08_12530 [Acidobacteriota bacterium]|nr:hypothetical protein [Acidobacteriota bacterium]
MKNLLLFLLFSLQALYCFAADQFLKTIQVPNNDCIGSVAILKSGDVIAGGVDFTSSDIILMQFSSSGDVRRAQRISGSGSDAAQAVASTSDGGAVVVGSTSSFGAGNTDAFILKLQASGSIAWKKYFGTSGNEHFVRVVQTPDKGFFALGDADHDPNLNDIVIVKFNPSGRPVWRKVISAGTFDHASDLRLTSDNGVIVTIGADLENGVRAVLVKLSASGSVQWSRIYGSSGNHIGISAFQAADGGYYFSETFAASNTQKSGTVLSKLNSEGIPEWTRIYKSAGSNLIASVSSNQSNNSLLLSGNISTSNNNSRGILFSVDQTGRVVWRKRVNPDSRPVFIGAPIISANDGSIVVAGCAGVQTSNNMDSILLRTQANGQIEGGCSKLITFPLSNSTFNLTSSEFALEEIPVPFLTGNAGFQVTTLSANETAVCSAE